MQDSRSLEQALLEVIRSADRYLWIVSYVLYAADQAVEALRERIKSDVTVRIVLEPSIGGGGTLNYDSFDWLRRHVAGAELLWWPTERRRVVNGNYGALHAKAAVADEHMAVISSANLTGRAMDANLELGILLQGGRIPIALKNQLDHMREVGILSTFAGI